MNLTDPSLYGVTYPQRDIGTTFMGPIQMPWQAVPRYLPFHAYGMQPAYPYGMPPVFAPTEKLGAQFPTQLPLYGTQPPLPQTFGYTMPFQGAPFVPPAFNPWASCGACNVPFNAPWQGWQRPIWY